MQNNNTKITFHVVRYKNFISAGNQFIEIELDKHETTLIRGRNGAGKSTILDAIFYALYGRAFRDINVDQLVNSINGKHSVVELEFSILGIRYKIVRGQKPAIFEIYKDGELIDQPGASRDYQKILDNQILKLKPQLFKQIVVIGAASYTQFMSLKPAERRSIIEDILEISVFTKMAELSRAEERTIKSGLTSTDSEINIRKGTIEKQRGLIDRMESEKETFQARHSEMVAESQAKLEAQIAEAQSILPAIQELKSKQESFVTLTEAINKANQTLAASVDRKRDIQKKISVASKSENCPTCNSDIGLEKRDSILAEYANQEAEIDGKIESLRSVIIGLGEKCEATGFSQDSLTRMESQLSSIRRSITQYKDQIAQLNSVADKFSGLDETKRLLGEETTRLLELSDKKVSLSTDMMYYNLISTMLKDNGIKATIVENYLPVINKYINQYLEAFDLFVGFELSSTFSETIRSRHRDTFSYPSFSEGEKSKIDLSILLTWRKIASMKSAASTNLLILDEVGSSTLDVMVYNDILRILFSSADNVISIAHRDQDLDMFDRIIDAEKPKNFSTITVSLKGE